jgi:hypothetical protein
MSHSSIRAPEYTYNGSGGRMVTGLGSNLTENSNNGWWHVKLMLVRVPFGFLMGMHLVLNLYNWLAKIETL